MKKIMLVLALIGGIVMGTEAKPVNPANNNAELLAISLIAKHEGFRSKVYICPAGKPTIGYGFTDSDLVKKGTITRAEADKILGKKVRSELMWVRKTFPGLNQKQQAAVVSLAFNIGHDKLLWKTLKTGERVHTNAYLKLVAMDFEGAAREIAEFRLCKGKVLAGLVKRRADEIALLV